MSHNFFFFLLSLIIFSVLCLTLITVPLTLVVAFLLRCNWFFFSWSHLSAFPFSVSSAQVVFSSLGALLFFGVMLGLRPVLGMPNVTMSVQNSWPAEKLRVSLGTLMMWKKPWRLRVGLSCLGWAFQGPQRDQKKQSKISHLGYSELPLKVIVTWKVLFFPKNPPNNKKPHCFHNLLKDDWELKERLHFSNMAL